MIGETMEDRKSPGELVYELIKLTLKSSWSTFIMKTKKFKKMVSNGTILSKLLSWISKRLSFRNSSNSNSNNNNGGEGSRKSTDGAVEYALQF